MIIDANEIESGISIQCDLCIIGAGAAGITIAREFDGTGLNVWLLESGGFKFERPTQDLYKGTATGHPYFHLDETRLRYFGGTTNHWTGMCRPLDAIDFEKRDWIPNSGWPFSRDHLVPWYKRAQTVCELDEFIYDAQHWLLKNQALLKFSPGTFKTDVYQPSAPTRFGKAYREQIKNSRNITACLHANATHLQANENARKLNSVNAQTLTGKQFSIQPRTCIIASGSIENARLLLASNDVQSNGLGNAHDVVGRYFMDHLVWSRGGSLMTKSGKVSDAYYYPHHQRRRRPVHFTLLLEAQSQRQQQIANYSAMFFTAQLSGGEKSYYQLRRTFRKNEEINNWWKHIGNILGDIGDVSEKAYYDYLSDSPSPMQLDLYNQWEQVPDPNNRITLDKAADALGMQKPKLNWQLGEIDRKTLISAQKILALQAGLQDFGRLKLGILEDDELPDTVRGDNHQMGTTRMHECPSHGVVNSDCRVHSIDNLYLAGASVFPTSGSTNPTLTVVALALRLANHLKKLL